MRCAAIDIGSNTTRVLVAERRRGGLRKLIEERAHTRIDRSSRREGEIGAEKVAELAGVVAAQVRVAEESGAEAIRVVATAAVRESRNADAVAREIGLAAGHEVDVLGEWEEGRLAFLGATGTRGHPLEGQVGVVDVGGGSSEVAVGSAADGVREVRSFPIGSGALAEEFLAGDPPSAGEIRALRSHLAEFFDGIELAHPDQALAVGGSATSLRTLGGPVLDRESLEGAVRVIAREPSAAVAERYQLDPRRVRILPAGVLILARLSELLGQPLRIAEGGLREGIVLDLLDRAGESR